MLTTIDHVVAAVHRECDVLSAQIQTATHAQDEMARCLAEKDWDGLEKYIGPIGEAAKCAACAMTTNHGR